MFIWVTISWKTSPVLNCFCAVSTSNGTNIIAKSLSTIQSYLLNSHVNIITVKLEGNVYSTHISIIYIATVLPPLSHHSLLPLGKQEPQKIWQGHFSSSFWCSSVNSWKLDFSFSQSSKRSQRSFCQDLQNVSMGEKFQKSEKQRTLHLYIENVIIKIIICRGLSVTSKISTGILRNFAEAEHKNQAIEVAKALQQWKKCTEMCTQIGYMRCHGQYVGNTMYIYRQIILAGPSRTYEKV